MSFDLQDFKKDVVDASETVPVVIDFWADWCGPCKQLSPVLEKLAKEAGDRWKLVKIDTEENPDLTIQFNVRGIPAVKMVYEMQIVAEFTGAQPEHLVRKWLEENLPASEETEEFLVKAKELLAEGKRDEARAILKKHLNEHENDEAFALYAMLCLPEDIATAERFLDKITDREKFIFEFEALQTIRHLKELQSQQNELSSKNPKALEHYKSGIRELFTKNFEGALENFLEALVLDRTLDDDGPRKTCLACFKILSEVYPLTLKYRRRFSMALY